MKPKPFQRPRRVAKSPPKPKPPSEEELFMAFYNAALAYRPMFEKVRRVGLDPDDSFSDWIEWMLRKKAFLRLDESKVDSSAYPDRFKRGAYQVFCLQYARVWIMRVNHAQAAKLATRAKHIAHTINSGVAVTHPPTQTEAADSMRSMRNRLGPEQVETFDAMVCARGDIPKAASRLGVSPTVVYGRLNAIRTVLGRFGYASHIQEI